MEHVSDTNTPHPLALDIARALDHRLHATLENPLHLAEARLYGCHVVDADAPDEAGSFRFTFIGESRSVYDLVEGPIGIVARAFDAAAVVTAGWGAPMNDDGSMDSLPSRHPDRFRILVTTVVCDSGLSSVVRNGHDPDTPVELAERGVGMMPDALEMMWFGETQGADGGWIELREPAGPRRGRHRRCA